MHRFVAYDNNRMRMARRFFAFSVLSGGFLFSRQQDETLPPDGGPPLMPPVNRGNKEARLPNGKSRNNAIAQDEHKKALAEAAQLVTLSEQLRDELQKAGNYIVPVTAVRKTEEIEKLAKKIRGRLKD
jgi:hypothetical protein